MLRRGFKAKGLAWKEYLISDAEDMLGAAEPFPEQMESLLSMEAAEILAQAPDIIGFHVQISTEECSLKLARRIKELSPKTTIIFGGPQCLRETKAFELIQESCVDAVAMAEADKSFVEFALAFDIRSKKMPKTHGFLVKENGVVIDCGDPCEVADLDSLPFMDFGDFEMDAYDQASLSLVSSRGCVRRCSFCTDIVQKKTYRRMSAERILSEIRHQRRHYPDRYFIRFMDSLINGDVRLISRLSELLLPFRLEMATKRSSLDFGWGGMAILHPTMTADLLRKMRRGGCQTLAYGFESASQKVVDLMRKNFRVPEAERIIQDTNKAGIRVQLFLMVGYPGETEKDFLQTIAFLEKNVDFIDIVDPSMCAVLKGSHLYVNRIEYGIRLDPAEPRLWSSVDGSNTIEIRMERHRLLLETMNRLGFVAEGDGRKTLTKVSRHAYFSFNN